MILGRVPTDARGLPGRASPGGQRRLGISGVSREAKEAVSPGASRHGACVLNDGTKPIVLSHRIIGFVRRIVEVPRT